MISSDRKWLLGSIVFLVIFLVYWLLGHPGFRGERVVMFFCVIILSGIILYYIGKANRGENIYLRPIPGLNAFEEAVGRATEMGKSVLFVPGIMDMDQVETVAGVIVLGQVARMTARTAARTATMTRTTAIWKTAASSQRQNRQSRTGKSEFDPHGSRFGAALFFTSNVNRPTWRSRPPRRWSSNA